MQLKLPQLAAHLTKNILPIYLISGDVPLLLRESKDIMRQAATQHGFATREQLNVESKFDSTAFTNLVQSYSLFADKTLIEIHNPNAKFDTQASNTLIKYLEKPFEDKLIVIYTNKLTSSQQKTKWFKAVAAAGATIAIWPPSAREFPQWIRGRMQQAGLNADNHAITLLAELTEGNLLATHQAIEKMRLLFPEQTISNKEVMAAISDSARFNVFDLVNYALQGQAARVTRVLKGLLEEGIEPILILWALSREVRTLITHAEQLQQGKPMSQVISREWASRKPLVQAALTRLSLDRLYTALQQANTIDQTIKGIQRGNVQNALTELSLMLAQK